ncbi:hypothetical protein JTE90_026895 [Oedothorax gibbosus]|uniref:Multiple inositol polyphosphate phosphatase 1 n=1 Tax=Oedothorax gibbosus TaxID=931172 RepID=A0AAV6UCP4_9ARAC|nr:hypothetical protein JTE90_026895 [Oedothorax gibbosus]
MKEIQVCLVALILILNLERIAPQSAEKCVTLDGSQSCFSTNPEPYRYYGTKTSYHVAIENNTDLNLPTENCQPKVFYLLSRHATRYPDKDWIVPINNVLPTLREKIISSYTSGNANFCNEDIEKLKQWGKTMNKKDDNRLSTTGEMEAENLARRYKEKFPSILTTNYSRYEFEYTSRERTRSTAEAFAKGLFGENSKYINFEGKSNDDVLTFHRACKMYKKNCTDPSYDLSEIEKFEKGPVMKKMVNSVSKRVGFTLSYEEVEIMYTACVFGYALNISDIWCSVFSNDELKVMEFEADIDDYYKDAYGNEINYKQACPIAKYIVDLFNSNKNSIDPKVVLQFSHAGGIKKVYPLFGLFRDEIPLTADAFCEQNDRKWRSSLISPFNSNIAFILYQCPDEHKVAIFHNEKAVQVNGCSSKLCSYKEFSETYEVIGNRCNIRKLCCTCCSD